MLGAMVIWMMMALLAGAAVLSILWPLSRRAGLARETDSAGDVGFYRDQLAEIGRDQDRGTLGIDEAEAARIEASRRLLRAANATPQKPLDTTSEPALRRRRAASAMTLSVVPIVGLALYGNLGSPHLRSTLPAAPQTRAAVPAEFASAVNRVEEHLAANPADVRGWDVLAPIYLKLGRFDDAARAFGTARRLGGDTLARVLGEGEALVSAAGGIVGPEARVLFALALTIEAASPAARYYQTLAAEQDGDIGKATSGYRQLLADAAPDAPWVPLVRARLARLDGGQDTGAPSALPSGAVTPEINAMVEGLDARLGAGGGSEAEWSRLVRSFAMLGRRADALDRLGKGRVALAGDPAAVLRLDQLAAELGLMRAASRP